MKKNYADMFHALHPDFFENEGIRSLPPEHVFAEQVLDLHAWQEGAPVACPAHITFGLYQGDVTALHEVIRQVEEDWVQYFTPESRVFCAFDGESVVSFCEVEEFGRYEGLRIGGPGCVGTLPSHRQRGIGLRMVQLATALLKAEGFDLSWIHYTHLGHWYGRLGYETVVRWNSRGIVM